MRMNKDQILTLPSGVEIPFRVVRPDDAPTLQRLHARCSARTFPLRFFGSMKKLSDEKVRYFASTDGVDHFGLVALEPEDPGRAQAAALQEALEDRVALRLARQFPTFGCPSRA
jgi:hypothetical protein